MDTYREEWNDRQEWEAEQALATKHQIMVQQAPKIALLLGVLFWMVLPRGVAVLLGQEIFTSRLPILGTVGSVLGVICSLIYALVLLKLVFVSERYRFAGMCSLAASAINVVMLFMKASVVTTVLVLVVVAITLAADYFELHGHAELLDDEDPVQAENFRTLWKWNIGATGALAVGLLLLVFSPFIGVVTLLTGATGVVIVAVRKLIFLHRAWVTFRDYE